MEESNQQQITPAAQPEVQPTAAQAAQPAAEPTAAQAPQPAVPVAQVYSPVPPVAPAENGKKKKGKGVVLALVIVLALAVLGAGAFFLFKGLGGSPEAKLKKGFENLQKEMEAYGNPLEKEIDFKTIGQMMATGASETNLSLNLTAPALLQGTLGMDIFVKQDFPNKLLDTRLAFSFANIPMVEGSVLAEGNQVYIDIPSLLPNAYFINTDTFGADYNASPWAWMVGYDVEEELSFDMFADADAQKDAEAIVKDAEEFFAEQAAALKEAMTITKAEDKVEITRADGKTMSCSGVRVVIEKAAVNDFVEAYLDMFMESSYMQQVLAMQAEAYAGYMDADEVADMFAEEFKSMFACFKNDLELCIYLDGKGRIVSVTTPEKIKFKGSAITAVDVKLEFTGTDRAMDEINGSIKFSTPYGDLNAKITRTAEITKETTTDRIKVKLTNPDDENMEFVYNSEWNLEEKEFAKNFSLSFDEETALLELEGRYTDIEKGESFTIELGKADLSFAGERLLGLFGTISVAPLSEDIEMPSDAKDLFGLSMEEFGALGYSISEALNALMGY